jgi:hypothetical protein
VYQCPAYDHTRPNLPETIGTRKSNSLGLDQLLPLYGSLRLGEDVEAFGRRKGLDSRPDVDLRRLVVYGMMHGLIRRVRVFPILERGGAASSSSSSSSTMFHREAEERKVKADEDRFYEEAKRCGDGDEEEEEEEEARYERSAQREGDLVLSRLLPLCDGRHCSDELCYRFAASYRELQRLLQADLRVIFIHR